MSGYWHDANYTTVGTAPAGSMIRPGDDLPVDDGNIALFFGGDEITVIEGEKDYLIGLLELALEKVKATSHNDFIPGDFLPEDTWYSPDPDEFDCRPEFITRDGGTTWTPLCGKCGREMRPLLNTNSSANWECINFDAHGLSLALIWAEDWPDYDEDDYCEHGNLIDADGTVSCDRCDYCPRCEKVTVWDGPECSNDHEEG